MPAKSQNSFDLLRLGAAGMVIFSHAFAVNYLLDPLQAINQQLTIGRLGLAIFFILSGYLVWQSWQRDPCWYRYLARRLLRLLPALGLAAMLGALLFGALLTTWPAAQYFSAAETWLYIPRTWALLTINQHLPGVLSTEPYPANQINAPLWTLPVEFSAYLLLIPIAMVISWIKFRGLFPAASALLLTLIVLISLTSSPQQFAALPGQIVWLLILFVLGMTLNSWGRRGGQLAPWLALPGMVLIITDLGPLGATLLAIALWAGALNYSPSWTAALRRRVGDLSYGLYIFTYPLQLLAVSLVPQFGAAGAFFLPLLISSPLAYLSWRYIESPALKLKPVSWRQ